MQFDPYIVVVGVDFSKLSNAALHKAFEAALAHEEAEVHAVSMVQAPCVDSNYHVPVDAAPSSGPSDLSPALERLRGVVQARFKDFAAKCQQAARLASLKVVSHVRVDSPAHGIVQLASDLGADLIVIGTHGRRGAERMFFGSVAEETVRYAPCPTLVVPPKAETSELDIKPRCPDCMSTRATSCGRELWCQRHREHRDQRHAYHKLERTGCAPIVSFK